ncbi:methylmalonyl-CoA mutase subunit beta [Bradyrhizobium sp.]|uniref:methylmalonyl-CoA mutase subunit beta n=1 Tax=Bradyrhizobium sp. TaxID=376 RepID=UPI002626503B|nr:methylmalonyl-CoA mutase subunit beta [Bradyrhizobium sp.]
MTSPDDLTLAAGFAPATYDDWRKLVDGVLKGAPFEKLVSKTYDGLPIEPIYRRGRNMAPIAGRPAAAPWRVMQRVDHPDPKAANAQAIHDLENGANGLEIEFAGGSGARGFGIPDATPDTLKRLFDGIFLDAGISIAIHPVVGRGNAGETLAALIEERRIDPAQIDLRFNYQALSTMAVRGHAPAAWSEMAKPFAGVVGGLMKRGFRGPFVLADGRAVHDAGGSEAQELAFALSLAVAYLRMLEDGGIDLEAARSAIAFRLAADADQFLTIAKFRALRLLWARLERACGLEPKPAFVAAETAWRMLTQRDPYVNMLRATMATFAAGLAGADAITVLPHTLARGLPEAFARRVARNTQLVLLEESNLAKVSDPAAGSGGIESLTQALCQAAWALFQEIENAGGAFAALEQNLIQRKVAATRAAREANIARRKDVLTGASAFPNLNEAQVAVLDVKPVELAPYGEATFKFDALPPMRLGAPFERLRDRSDEILKAKGARPKVFLANLGTAADFTTRATFAKSLFETGGIEASGSEGFGDPAALAAAFKASGAALACICSSDKVYAEQAEVAARALQAAGAKLIYLAGRGGQQQSALRAAGVGDFIFAGSDALAVLQQAYRLTETA